RAAGQLLAGHDLQEGAAAAGQRAAGELGQAPQQPEDDQERENDPNGQLDHAQALSDGPTISVIRMPKFSSMTTTSPRAMSRPLTSRSAGPPAARSSSITAPGVSDSSSRTLMRVRPSSAVTSISTSWRRSNAGRPRSPR